MLNWNAIKFLECRLCESLLDESDVPGLCRFCAHRFNYHYGNIVHGMALQKTDHLYEKKYEKNGRWYNKERKFECSLGEEHDDCDEAINQWEALIQECIYKDHHTRDIYLIKWLAEQTRKIAKGKKIPMPIRENTESILL